MHITDNVTVLNVPSTIVAKNIGDVQGETWLDDGDGAANTS